MLLNEIAQPSSEDIMKWFTAVNRYVISNISGPDFEVAIRKLLYVFPKSKFTGDMYRAISLDSQSIAKNPSAEGIMNSLNNYKSQHKRNLYGWAKELDQAETFAVQGHDKFVVMVHQYHVGIDLQVLYQNINKTMPSVFSSSEFKEGLQNVMQEGEVVATIAPEAQIVQFHVANKLFSASQFEKALAFFKQH